MCVWYEGGFYLLYTNKHPHTCCVHIHCGEEEWNLSIYREGKGACTHVLPDCKIANLGVAVFLS